MLVLDVGLRKQYNGQNLNPGPLPHPLGIAYFKMRLAYIMYTHF